MDAELYATVLLVEDDPGDVLLITEALEASGAPRVVHVASDGVEALQFLRRQGRFSDAVRPDVVLLDLNMPRMDGRQVLAEVKRDEHLKTLPVIVFTTSSAQEDIVTSYNRHANAYVTKPVDVDGLMVAVRKIDEFFTRVIQQPPATTGDALGSHPASSGPGEGESRGAGPVPGGS